MENKCLNCGLGLTISDLNNERDIIEFYMSGSIALIVKCLHCNKSYSAIFDLVQLDENIHIIKNHPTFNIVTGKTKGKVKYFSKKELRNA